MQGIAINLIIFSYVKLKNPNIDEFRIHFPRILNLKPNTQYGHLKSSIVGHLVSLKGYVVRVSACSPLVISACFSCSKCSQYTRVTFEDGIFSTPTRCVTDKYY